MRRDPSLEGTLGEVNGTHKLSAPADIIIAVRTGAATFIALSAICTHESCSVLYASDMTLRCPCHGSIFQLDGEVTVVRRRCRSRSTRPRSTRRRTS